MVERQDDLLADKPAKQMGHVIQGFMQIQNFRFQSLLAGEGQKLAHQTGRAIGILADLREVTVIGVAFLMAQHQQVAMARDRRQEVVEIVGHAACQLANGLHLLALHKLCLQRLQLGGIIQCDNKRRPRFVGDPRDRDL